jgi:uncharacterized membrane protein (DUF4010 family)
MDAVTLSLAEMDRKQHIPANVVVDALYLAMLANALLKTVLAYTAGGRRFGWHALAGFLWMFVPGAAVVLASGR